MADTLPAPPPVRKPEDHRVRNNPVATATVASVAAALVSIGAALGLDLDEETTAAVVGAVVTVVGAISAWWARSQAWGPLSHHEAVREAGASHPEPTTYSPAGSTANTTTLPPGWGEPEA